MCTVLCILWDGKGSKTVIEIKKDLQTRAIDISGLVSVGRRGEAGGWGGVTRGCDYYSIALYAFPKSYFQRPSVFVVYTRDIRIRDE